MWTVVLAVRDSRSTRGAQRELLMALCLRARREKKYCCFPSYALLSEDTNLHPITLKRAAAELEKMNLIKRFKRRNSSNVFRINVALLLDQAAAAKAAKDEKKRIARLNTAEGFEGFADPRPLAPEGLDDDDEDEDKAAETEYQDDDTDDLDSDFADREEL
jgi:DNA-binding MarR family transcriptional regulator